ncbi:MAG: HNH endonuclease signature motif containing protein [Candidatus Latescibacterota bacterium]
MKPKEQLFFQLVAEGYYSFDAEGNVWVEKPRNQVKSFTRYQKSARLCNNYCYFVFAYHGKRHFVAHHRLVYIHHHGDIPDGMQINHIDGDYWNNHISNLEAVTPSENALHAFNVIKTKKSYGVNNPHAKLTEEDIRTIYREHRGMNLSYKKIAEKYGISKSHAWRICTLGSWKHVWRVDGKIAGEIGREPDIEQMEEMPEWGFWDRSEIKPGEVCDA